ncbi:MAG TPA: tetratricopeptide repeat protein, partial [Kofleriaceae bacterium]|nr:tetratricopeptide repeat protein [Kofleriaceae bacterium]
MRWVVLGVVVALAAPARADDIKTADEKFEAARKLEAQGDHAGACALFSDSLALNPNAIGTILNVGLCAEHAGRIATAIRYFSDARDRAREQNLAPQLGAAEEHLAQLTPRAPHLAIAFSESSPDGKLLVANKVVSVVDASDILVDPGQVSIVMSAPGRVPYSTTIEIAEGQHKALAIPQLGYPVTTCTACRLVGKSLVGVGAAAFLTSVIVGWKSHSDWNHDVASCMRDGSGTYVCAQGDFNKVNSDLSLGNAATIIGVAGGVLLVGGAALWYFTPEHAEHAGAVSFVPVVTPDQAGLA